MKAAKWTWFVSLCLMGVHSNSQQHEELCGTRPVSAHLGSSVLLSCNFSTNSLERVLWTQGSDGTEMLQLSSDGRVLFKDPRAGRVKALPIQASQGNFSVIIDELKKPDLGSYYCKRENECVKVELSEYPGEQFDEKYFKDCQRKTVSSALGTSVVLPCTSFWKDPKVNWFHSKREVLRLSSGGRVTFNEPRSGRIKAFPNEASLGNFSIVLDDLQESDLGSFYCKVTDNCVQVQLDEHKNTPSSETLMLIYICVGVTLLVLLCIGGYLCWWKITCPLNKSRQENTNVAVSVAVDTEAGASAPPAEEGISQTGAVLDNSLVYENDDQFIDLPRNLRGGPQRQDGTEPGHSSIGVYPNLDEFKFEREESQKKKQGFHKELFNRLRQASLNRHFYVNQGEIRKQQAMAAQEENQRAERGRNKAKDNQEYKNPIYNRSTDHLDRL